jgi:hypothetical protein
MKKILFIATRNPYSGKFSGDVIGSLKIIKFLKKKYNVTTVCLGVKKLKKKNILIFRKPNFFLKILSVIFSILKMKPLQFGLFYSKKMHNYIINNAKNYDLLFFYHIRSSQYFPENYKGKSVIEMGDLYSHNYFQTFCNLSIFNPFKYIYLLESFFIRRIENDIFKKFDKIILFSMYEIKKISKVFRKKVFKVNLSVGFVRKKFLFTKKNNKILFIGNLNYLPNLLAVRDFVKNILPPLLKRIPNINFYVIGNIGKFDKFLLSRHRNTTFLGQQRNITRYIKNSFFGLANLKIATGIQGKVLTYMSYGLPVICSKKVSSNFKDNVINYSNNIDLITKIINLKKNKKLSNKFSKKSLKFARKHDENKIGSKYLKIVNFNKKLS